MIHNIFLSKNHPIPKKNYKNFVEKFCETDVTKKKGKNTPKSAFEPCRIMWRKVPDPLSLSEMSLFTCEIGRGERGTNKRGKRTSFTIDFPYLKWNVFETCNFWSLHIFGKFEYNTIKCVKSVNSFDFLGEKRP